MTHEVLGGREPLQPPSERSFAIVFTVVFALVAVWPLVKGRPWRPWALAVSALVLAIGLLAPSLLRVPNRLWFGLAILLNRVTNPIVTALLFFLVVTPFALLVRLTGKDLLRLRRDPLASTYWIRRDPPGPEPETMVEQF